MRERNFLVWYDVGEDQKKSQRQRAGVPAPHDQPLARQQRDSDRDQQCRDPAAAVDFFVQEDFCGEGIADEGE